MNPSPSAQSVGSQKPSTAASTASGRRTRTIIVARNLPEAGPATTPSSSSTTSAPPSLQSRHSHASRDAKSVRLSSYAALGSEADVELYERFLSEKKAVLARSSSGDSSQAIDGSASPAFLKGSPKRRTMAHLINQSGDGSDSGSRGGDAPTSPAAAMLEEAAADAKLRRDAVVQHRKWLKSLPIHERLAYERQQNVIHKWKAINRQWEAFKQRTAKKLGKSEKQLVMARASEYREQIEMYDALQRAMPLSEKVAGDFWLVSLRNEGTRYVPVGNIFSGLYCPIRESSKLQPRVRRPLDYLDTLHASDDGDADVQHHGGKQLSAIERRSLEALEKKKRRLKKQLEALYPHDVEPSHSGQLKVDSMDLFEWASAGRESRDSHRQHTASTRSLLLPLEEDDQENNADGINSHRSTARSRQSAKRKGPSVRVFASAMADEEPGPSDGMQHFQSQPVDLTFFADIGVLQHHTIFLENNGTTALQFQWRREDLVDKDLAVRLTHYHPNPLSEPERIASTSISQVEGVVLPDEILEFVLSFRSQRAGVWLERWLLDVDPAPRGVSKREPAAVVRLQCTAVDNFVPASQRRKLHKATEKAETTFMAEQVLKQDIIHRVDPSYAIEFPELSEQARLFYDTHRRGEFENVQYSERLMEQCRSLYADALAVVTPPTTEPEDGAALAASPRPVESSPRDPATDEAAHASPSPLHPLEWDRRLISLKDMAIAADEKLRVEYTSLKNQFIAERGEQQDEDEEDEEEDLMEKILGTKAAKKAAQQDALRALTPHFVDDFQSITLAAHVSPYEPRLLTETLAEKLAAMASEAAVVLEIAQMTGSAEGASVGACELLSPLLVRALDESFVVDSDRERVFEYAKRHFQSVKLDEKIGFHELPRLTVGHTAGAPLVVFLQVDLDIANWFALASSGGPGGPLEWKLSQKLLDHHTHVPPKIAAASHSIQTLLETMEASGHAPTVVLLSELSSPPMSKAMKRMEVAAARAKAVAAVSEGADGAPAPAPTPGEIETMRQRLAVTREKQLSLRGVDTVLQRAMRLAVSGGEPPTVEFVGSLQELEAAIKPTSPLPLTTDTSVAETDGGEGEEPAVTEDSKPRVLLLDHLGALSRQALKKPQAANAGTTAQPTAVAPVTDKGKAPAANDKRKSTAQPAPPQAKVPAAETPAVEEEDTIEILPGMSIEIMAAQSLGQRLAQLGRFLVADYFPQSWWETSFVYFTAPLAPATPTATEGDEAVVEVEPPQPRHVLVGPQLTETFKTWQSLFQPSPTDLGFATLAPICAIVGGRGLDRKLRLIDGLLEHASTIYFVGELAATLYRVLYTKQLIQAIRRERKPVPRYESQQLIPVVERLIQKAYRKHVELLLPFDFAVGESPIEQGEDGGAGGDDGDDDDDEDQDEEDEEEEEDDDDPRKKKSKRAVAPQKPLQEPPEVETWRPRKSYDGERCTVEVGSINAWVRVADVTVELVASVNVVDGKSSLLEAPEAETDESPTSLPPVNQVIPDLDWTSRIFDVGPKSTRSLLSDLRTHHDERSGWIFLNGSLGAVEYQEFDVATREVVRLLQSFSSDKGRSLLMTGTSTCRWLGLLDHSSNVKHPTQHSPVVSSHTAKLGSALSYIVESKPHATLTAFDSSA